MCRIDFVSFTFGLARVEPVFSPPVLDITTLGALLSLRSSTQFNSTLVALDDTSLGVSLFPKSFAHLRSLVPLFGLARPGALPSTLNLAHSGTLLVSQSHAKPNLSSLAFGLARSRSVFPLPVLDIVSSGFLLPSQSLVYLGFFSLVSGFSHYGSPLSLHSFTHSGLSSLACGIARAESVSLLGVRRSPCVYFSRTSSGSVTCGEAFDCFDHTQKLTRLFSSSFGVQRF